MKCRVRLMLTNELGAPFAGIGVIRLLRAIEEHGSINHAAKVCGLSYLKAWNMMNRLDTQLGQQVLKRTSGGKRGGGAKLTPFGIRFLKSFEAYHRRVTQTADTEWKRFAKVLATILLCAITGLTGCSRTPNEVQVAATSSMQYAMDDMIARFQEEHPQWTVEGTYGSSGAIYAQLMNRDPFDIFFSADHEYPAQLIEQWDIEQGALFEYAVGRLALWVPKDSPIDVQEMKMTSFFHPTVIKIALANTRHAPYGRAAEAAMNAYGVYYPTQAKLVHGETVAQAAQFIESGAAQIGIIALSLAVAPPMQERGTFWEIPADRYPRLAHAGIILPWARNQTATEAFRAYVLGETGQAILKEYGFTSPED